jgi:hypothetical protein
MTYSREDDQVTLKMSRVEYLRLLGLLGVATGTLLRSNDRETAYRALAFANEVNEGNPEWTPFEIPEFR